MTSGGQRGYRRISEEDHPRRSARRGLRRPGGSVPRGSLGRAALAAAVGTLLLLVGIAYAYDRHSRDTIAPGVRVAGVDVGGLDRSDAAARLRARTATVRPRIVLTLGAQRIVVDARRELRWRPDVGAMVSEALARSRSGGVAGRLWRAVRGARVDAELPLRAAWSQSAVDRTVRRVAERFDVAPRDAELVFPSLARIPHRDGRTVRGRELVRAIDDALARGRVVARIAVPVRVRKARTTLADLPNRWPLLIVVDRSAFTLRLYDHLRLVRSYPVAIGAIGYDTPTGLYRIQSKAVNPAWHVPRRPWAGDLAGKVIPPGPDNPIKARWLGFYDGAGIHGTDAVSSIGSRASHGCVRMRIPDVIDLYDRVPVGTPIYIGG